MSKAPITPDTCPDCKAAAHTIEARVEHDVFTDCPRYLGDPYMGAPARGDDQIDRLMAHFAPEGVTFPVGEHLPQNARDAVSAVAQRRLADYLA